MLEPSKFAFKNVKIQDPSKRPDINQLVHNLQALWDATDKELIHISPIKHVEQIQHTYHLYLSDEAMSTLQKAVRRGKVKHLRFYLKSKR